MSDIENKRSAVLNAYDGKAWKEKVLHMPDHQIVALYFSLVKRGRIQQ